MNQLSRFSVLLLTLSIALSGCGSHKKSRQVRLNHPPKAPPAVPPAVNVPIDPALQASARQEITTALAAPDAIVRAHAVEALRESIGAAGASDILLKLNDQ